MAAAIALREDYRAEDLRALARQRQDIRQYWWFLALAAVAEGRRRVEAAEICGMDRQTLRVWVHRFNGEGPEGLLDRKTAGPAPKLIATQKAELATLVEAGPDRKKDGVVRWRRVDLKTVIEDRFGVVYHERSVSRLLHEFGFSHLSARPRHPAQKTKVLEDFKKTSRARSPRQ